MYLVELLLSSVMVVSLADIYSVNLRYVTMPLKLENSVVIEYIKPFVGDNAFISDLRLLTWLSGMNGISSIFQ